MAASLSNPHRKTRAAPRPHPRKKSGTRDPQNSPPPERLACPHVTISESLKGFLYFNFETNFLENEN